MSRWAVLAACLCLPLTAGAHPKGFHKKSLVTVGARAVEALIALDLDGGPRSALLRQGSDDNGDGVLSGEELKGLKGRLVTLAARPFKVEIAGYPLRFTQGDSRVELRGDRRVGEGGLSVAVLLKAELPREVTPGMVLLVGDEAPDGSHVLVEVYQAILADAGSEGPARGEVQPGQKLEVRLGRLADLASK